MNENTKFVNIPGSIHSTTQDNVGMYSDELYDKTEKKKQNQINKDFKDYASQIHAENEELKDALENLDPDQTEALALSTKVNTIDKSLSEINVNRLVNRETPFDTQNQARLAVINDFRKLELKITYLLKIDENNSTLITEQFIGDDVTNWNDANNWKVIGPVSVSQNTSTGHTDINVGGTTHPVASVEEVSQLGQYIDNPEWVQVVTDNDDKILYGVKTDGKFYFGDGCPPQVVDYIQNIINELSLDEYEDIVDFLNNLEKGDKTLQTLLNEKVDKEEGKSLIDAEYASTKSVIDNPEFLDVTIDAEDKILEGLKRDGTKVIAGDFEILGNMEVSGVSYKVVRSPEYLAAWVDAEDKIIFGFKTDGKTYVGDADFLNDIEDIKSFLAITTDKGIDWEALSSITTVENFEFIEAKTDSEGKLLAGRTSDGAAFETVGFSTPKVSIDGNIVENIENPEGRIEVKTDSENKILSYRDSEGVMHEEVGINSRIIESEHLRLTEKGLSELKGSLDNSVHYKRPNIPYYGIANIKSETFYLSIGNWSSYADDIVLIQVYDDTDENAAKRFTISTFYIKSTLTPLAGGGYDRTSINENSVALEIHAGKDVVAISDKFFAKTLWIPRMYGDAIRDYTKVSATKVTDPVTGDVIGYEYNGVSTEVKQVIDVPPYKVWKVTKEIEHYCIVDFDFGEFYNKKNVAIGVKYQGSSTTAYRKRNFRFTFYKNDTFSKKNKVKIGDMLRLSGYNLKANWTDKSRVKEMVLYPTLLSIWQQRPEYNRFPWYNGFDEFTAATGFIQGFPIRLNINGNFYGMMVFGLKKDEKNYVLDGDDDTSGIFVSGSAISSDCWQSPQDWEDEMMDDMSQETTDAISEWFDFINGRLVDENQNPIPFNIKNIPSRMDVQGFIDYFICLQVFNMWDNTQRNLVLHTRSDKKKFYPFFYDLDNSLQYSYNSDIFEISSHISDGQGGTSARDMSFWETIRDTFWDDIVSRYLYLRGNVLTIEYFTQIYHAYADIIPDSDYADENQRWNIVVSKRNFDDTLILFNRRLKWLDENYFKY